MKEISLQELMGNPKNAPIFKNELKNVLNPRFDEDEPEKYGHILERLTSANRQSFPKQAQKVAEIVSEFEGKKTIGVKRKRAGKSKAIILSAEMGSGKSDMASKVAACLENKAIVNMIMCPPHLVDKWEDELRLSQKEGEIFKIIKVNRWNDLAPYTKRDMRKDKNKYFFILSRETAKLGYPKVDVFVKKQKKILLNINDEFVPQWTTTLHCPDCDGNLFEVAADDDGNVSEAPDSVSRKCQHCKTVLRDVDRTVSKNMQTRLSIAEYIKRTWTKGTIDLLIVDEIHEYKGGNTGQGQALAQICSVSKRILGLTGTLLNGYASSLFYILYRINPSLMAKKLGFAYNEVKEFINRYGAYERTYEAGAIDTEGTVTKRGKQMSSPKEKPKISPHLLSVLLDTVVFLRLDEIKMEEGEGLPPYREEVCLVEKDAILDDVDRYITELASKAKKDKAYLGNLANDSIAVYDMPFQSHVAQGDLEYLPSTTREEHGPLNKELKLIEICEEEFEKDRNVLVFVHFSNKGVGRDIENVLNDKFPHKKIKFLPPSIQAKKRQKWIEDNPCDVLICNPELVKTGLDLLQFPTIVFYETTYNVCATC